MWALPDGWTSHHHGDAILMFAPRGIARIVIQENLRPAGDIDALVAAIALPGLVVERSSMQRFATCEGERALVVSARTGSASVELGFVFLDDTYVRVMGHGVDRAAIAARVRDLVTATRVFLSASRRRAYWYDAPSRWKRAASASADTTWLAPSYPEHRAAITVLRAIPVAARAHFSIVGDLFAHTAALPAPTAITTRAGLEGHRWLRRITSPDHIDMDVIVVGVSDGTYDYHVRAIVPRGEHAELVALVDSIEPLSTVGATSILSTSLAYLAL